MATSTHIKVDAAKIPANLDDAYFKKPQEKKQKEVTEAGLFGDKQAKKEMDAKRVADQKTVDALLLAEIKKVPALKSYLNASFSLTKGQVPHLMKF
jgi:large subunit ribosomal protein L6e